MAAHPFKRVAAFLLAGACAATALAQSAQQDLAITAAVPRFCTINGSATGGPINTVIPVDGNGVVDTTPQNFSVGNVVCNAPTSVEAKSLNGGVKSANKSGPDFTNIINYRGTATFGTAKSTINTGTLKGAAGPEAGPPDATAGPTQGALQIQVRPAQPTSPLILGSDYNDVLRITLTPQ